MCVRKPQLRGITFLGLLQGSVSPSQDDERDTETLTWKLQIAKANSWRLLHHLWPLSWSHIQKEVKRSCNPLYISKCGAWPESWDVAIQGSATLDIKGIFKVLLCQRFSLGFISFIISCWAWKSSQWLKRLKLLTQPGMSCYFKVSSCSYICMCVCACMACVCVQNACGGQRTTSDVLP